MDRGYTDFDRLYQLHRASALFVIRAKSNLKFRRIYPHPVDKETGLRRDQTVTLTGFYSARNYPDKLRRIKYRDAGTEKRLVLLTNNFSIPAITIAELYRHRWQVELFFKMDQATSAHRIVLRHIGECRQDSGLDCRLRLCASRHHQEATQCPGQPLFDPTDFEPDRLKKPIGQLLTKHGQIMEMAVYSNQLNFFD